MGRTTLEIDDELLRAAMEVYGTRTKTEIVDLALRELVRRRQLALLREEMGSFDLALDLDELRRLREAG